jgi:hypothetical protein
MIYEILGTRTFTAKNPYSAQNALYELTDVMSKYRDSKILVWFETNYYGSGHTEVVMKLVKEKT